ncbi:GTPase [Sulfuracidifex metallicus]|uniref:GTPase RsgA n=1 Tax=Sulfuracidifex metallicus DSM 6482 = JCM 9184 TaxID=523847 RepID=A0A6A9QFX9_SULME|nr:GTPase [Sulfuracidifex metallicus]MUN28127.1 GTPase RsgA [Sulfuracidifex metallicus DSM 6482 = JCM 9184]WOE51332.1 50S ribosome-binding GTPase [Sulfuracidifex metallicus DSM 6482 = JCM 9184]
MLNKVLASIRRVDVIVEVLDSREPDLTRSKEIERYAVKNGRQVIIVLNKIDLIPREVADRWKDYLSKEFPTVYVSTKMRQGTRLLRDSIKEALKGEGNVAFVGYPKTGKSSIVNVLKGRKSASVSSQPMSTGFTKGIQLIKIDSKIYALDTPGIIPPHGNPFEKAIRGSNPDNLENPIPPALIILEKVFQVSPALLETTYKVNYLNGMQFLQDLAKHRGWINKEDKEPDLDLAAKTVIKDYHNGKITYYTLPPE